MHIKKFIWLPEFIDKLEWKHNVTPEEVQEIFNRNPFYRKVQKGHIPGENLYSAFGQTSSGRYLAVFFIYKVSGEALIISARDMDNKEKKQYGRR